VIPEVDQITIDPSFYDGDSVGIFAADYSINLTIVYAASQTFSSSSYSGGVLTVGISDGPSIDQVCDLIRSTLNSHGGSATYPDDGSGVITNTSSTPAQWTLTCSVADGTTLVAAQAGINGVALASTLASYGPFVITN
jgi:hypothetical protein